MPAAGGRCPPDRWHRTTLREIGRSVLTDAWLLAASSHRSHCGVPGFDIGLQAVHDCLGGGAVLFGELHPMRERGLNVRHLPVCRPTSCYPRNKAARGTEHQSIALQSVRRVDLRRKTIGHQSEAGIRTVAIDSSRLLVVATSGQLIWQSRVSAEGRHDHPHPTDHAGTGSEKPSSFLGTNQDAGTAMFKVERLLR
jgi:hypothetical protein